MVSILKKNIKTENKKVSIQTKIRDALKDPEIPHFSWKEVYIACRVSTEAHTCFDGGWFVTCPKCGSDDVDVINGTYTVEKAVETYKCNNCGKIFTLVLTFDGAKRDGDEVPSEDKLDKSNKQKHKGFDFSQIKHEIDEQGIIIFDLSPIKDGLVLTVWRDEDEKIAYAFAIGETTSLPIKKKEIGVFSPKFIRDIQNELALCGIWLKKSFVEQLMRFVDRTIQNHYTDAIRPKVVDESEGEDFEIVGSDGLTFPGHGFFYAEGDRFIVTEYTKLWVRTKSGKTFPKAFLVVNNSGERKIIPFPVSDLRVGDRPIDVTFHGYIEVPITTLMSKTAVDRFLAGETVEFKDVFNKIKKRIAEYINFKRRIDLKFAAARVIESYFVDMIQATGLFYFAGLQGSGKTRANTAVTLMSRKGFLLLNPTDASTFRLVEALKPTIGIDEEFTSAVRLILKGGYKKGVSVFRCERSKDGKIVLAGFEPYACYNLSLKDAEKIFDEQTLRRLHRIDMVRDIQGITPKEPEACDFEDIRDDCYILRLTRALEFKKAYDEVREEYKERLGVDQLELYGGLLTVARLVDPELEKEFVEEIEHRKTEFLESVYERQRFLLRGLFELIEQRKDELKSDTLTFTMDEFREVLKEIYLEDAESEEEKKRRKTTFSKYYPKQLLGRYLKEIGVKVEQDWSRKQEKRGIRIYKVTFDDIKRLVNAFAPDMANTLNDLISHIKVVNVANVAQQGESSIQPTETGEERSQISSEKGDLTEKSKENGGQHWQHWQQQGDIDTKSDIPQKQDNEEIDSINEENTYVCTLCSNECTPIEVKPFNENDWICFKCWVKQESIKLKNGRISLNDFLEQLKEFCDDLWSLYDKLMDVWKSDHCKECIRTYDFRVSCVYEDKLCQTLLQVLDKAEKIEELWRWLDL